MIKPNSVVVLALLAISAQASFAQPAPPPTPPDPKPADPKPPDPKPADPKPGDPKPADAKPSDPKPADAKPADPKPEGSTPFEDEPVSLPSAGVKPTPAATSETTRGKPTTLDELTVTTARARIELNVFGAAQFRVSKDEHYTDFVLAPLGFVVSGRMSDSLSALSEFVMETTDEGEAVVDLERVVLRWNHDRFSASAGRTHTELGYWNTAFHHGTWLQLTTDRPLSLRFEDDGGLLPIHWIGAWGEYRHPMPKGTLRTVLQVGNGRGSNVDDIRVASDVNLFKAINLNISLDNVLASGSRVGAAVLVDRIKAASMEVRPALPDEPILEVISNVYASFRGDTWTAIAEGYLVSHRADGMSASSLFGFGLIGYTIDRYTPYVMVEGRKAYGDDDAYFDPDPMNPSPVVNFGAVNAGIRAELSTWSSLKLQVDYVRIAGDDVLEGVIDWAFGL